MKPLDNVEEITPHLDKRRGGPRTDAGRARASLNACKHYIHAKIETLPNELREDFDKLHATYIEEYQPRTITEQFFVRKLAETHWREGRVLNAETKAIKEAGDKGESVDKTLERFGRYSGNLSRQYQAALKTLKEHQAPRIHQHLEDWRQAVVLREYYQNQGIDWDPADDEFVFSKEEIDRQTKFNYQWNRFCQMKNVVINSTSKSQDERFLPRSL